MPFCTKCGADVAGVRFCAQCGTPVEAATGGEPSRPGAGPSPSSTGPTGAGAASGMADNLAAALAYITPIAIVFLLIEPYKSIPYVRFHSFQSIFFCVAAIVLQIALGIVGMALGIAGMGLLMGMLSPLVSLGIFVLWIVLVVKAYQGEKFSLPVIGEMAARQ